MPKGQDIAKAMTKAERGSPQGTSDPSSPNHGKYKGGCSEDNPSGRGFGAGAGAGAGAYMKESGVKDDRPLCETAKAYSGWHTSLKPAWEPIIIARKPCEGTVVQNTLKHGTGGLNIDACRLPIDPEIDDPRLGGKGTWETGAMAKTVYGDFAGETVGSSELGRFPSNVITDGSEIIEDIFSGFGEKTSGVPGKRRKPHETHSMSGRLSILDRTETGYGDAGSASRFFYQAKATAADRDGSKHVSVKPIALMRYLCKLVTPKGGIVLDPFAGSGTTGQAAIDEGFKAILIEREAEYCADIRARLVLFLED
jgi:site-specific DNA-methyltransferase (adenine-specific)